MSDSETPSVRSDPCVVCGVLTDDLIVHGEAAICRDCHAGLTVPLEDDGTSDEEAVDQFMDAIESLDRDVRRYRVYARDLMPGDRIVAEWVYPKGDSPSHEARLGGERLEKTATVQFITTDVDGDIVTTLVGVREAVTYPKWRTFSVDREV